MEQKSLPTCLASTHEIMEPLHDVMELLCDMLTKDIPPQLEVLDMDTRFLAMFFGGFEYWEEVDDDDDWDLHLGTMVNILWQIAEDFEVPPQQAQGEIMNWEKMCCDFQKKIKELKQPTREICFLLLGGAYKCKPCQHGKKLCLEYGIETASFINFVLENLESLDSKIHLTAPIKQQIYFISGKLKMFGNFVDLVIANGMTRVTNLRKLLSRTRTWANHISYLVCLYWIDGMNENFASTLGTVLSDLMHITMPYTPEVIVSYLNALQVVRYHKIADTVISQLPTSYVDFLLEDLVIPANDDVEILREGLIFLLSFVMDQPMENPENSEVPSDDGKHILGKIDAIISEVPSLIGSIRVDEIKEGILEIKLSDFLQKIERVRLK